MALPRSAMTLRSLAAPRRIACAATAVPAASTAGARIGLARALSTSQPARGGGGGGGGSSSGAHQEEAHEEYPREDFSGPFFRNTVIVLAVFGVIYKVSDINNALHASRASSSGKSSFQDAEHAEEHKPWLTRYIESYTTPREELQEVNAQWAVAVQRTAESKLLVQSAERPPVARLRHIGSFEAGSPHAVMLGTQVDLSDLKIKKDNE